jgi:hypothetical protein
MALQWQEHMHGDSLHLKTGAKRLGSRCVLSLKTLLKELIQVQVAENNLNLF